MKKDKVELVGNTHETAVVVEGTSTIGLIDTGSQITTIANWFFKEHLKSLDMETIEDFLEIKLADGQLFPYIGIVLLDLVFPHVDKLVSFPTPVVIVNDTEFNRRVPVLLGTNVMEAYQMHLKNKFGANYIQKSKVSTPWKLGFQCLNAQARVADKVGQLVSSKPVCIPADATVQVKGLIKATCPQEILVCTEEEDFPQLPSGLMLTPSVHSVDFTIGSKHSMSVEVRNFTQHDITLPANSIVCGVFPAKIHHVVNCHHTNISSSTYSEMSEFLEQFKIGTSLSESEEAQVNQLLCKWKDIFSCPGQKIGCANYVKHHIPLSDPTPIKEPHRRIPPHLYEEVRSHLKEMLDEGIIHESSCPFSSPTVLVRKPDNSLRFCVDFRKLNAKKIRDSHAIPRIDETLDSLAGARYFSSLDLKTGYWQLELEEADKEKTAFSAGPLGFFEYNRMPMDLVNAPACFQRLMQRTMGDLHLNTCSLYLGDIIVFSKTFEEQLIHLDSVFQRLKNANLTLKPSKCYLFQKQVKYLGHIVSEEGIQTDPSKIECLKKWPPPKNIKEVRRFIGFAGFYRRFIRNFSKIAKPIHELLRGDIPCKKRSAGYLKKFSSPIQWKEIHQIN